MKYCAKIQKKKYLNRNIFSLEVIIPDIKPLPGQFFQIQVDKTFDPFLNRPISIASYSNKRCLFVVKIVGRGTEILGAKSEGEILTIFGPYGKGINIQKKKSLLIAGGIGVAPIFFLAQKLKDNRIDFTFVYGAKSPDELVLKKDIKKISPRAIFIAEKGSIKKGTVITALKEMELGCYEVTYACGPREMVRELKSLNLKMPVYAFLEDFLGCGCGLCLGCAIKYYGEYKRICDDGPVFELAGIEFD